MTFGGSLTGATSFCLNRRSWKARPFAQRNPCLHTKKFVASFREGEFILPGSLSLHSPCWSPCYAGKEKSRLDLFLPTVCLWGPPHRTLSPREPPQLTMRAVRGAPRSGGRGSVLLFGAREASPGRRPLGPGGQPGLPVLAVVPGSTLRGGSLGFSWNPSSCFSGHAGVGGRRSALSVCGGPAGRSEVESQSAGVAGTPPLSGMCRGGTCGESKGLPRGSRHCLCPGAPPGPAQGRKCPPHLGSGIDKQDVLTKRGGICYNSRRISFFLNILR